MFTLIKTDVFAEWLDRLEDRIGRARILARLTGAELGNLGDCAPVGDCVPEMRIHVGPGYRVYFTRSGKTIYLLLCGGDKSSQRRDIKAAKAIASELKVSDP